MHGGGDHRERAGVRGHGDLLQPVQRVRDPGEPPLGAVLGCPRRHAPRRGQDPLDLLDRDQAAGGGRRWREPVLHHGGGVVPREHHLRGHRRRRAAGGAVRHRRGVRRASRGERGGGERAHHDGGGDGGGHPGDDAGGCAVGVDPDGLRPHPRHLVHQGPRGAGGRGRRAAHVHAGRGVQQAQHRGAARAHRPAHRRRVRGGARGGMEPHLPPGCHHHRRVRRVRVAMPRPDRPH
mmetsp:Transcript_21606/g.53573  ORF Transcript_21606/g.53573 Transcript_21606/m.53573 type:complete len:235 (-) Transcript_21606:73-777(-)